MKTVWLLLGQYEKTLIPLEDVRRDFFPHLNMEMFKLNVRFEFLDVCYFGENHEDEFNTVLRAVMQLAAEGKITELKPISTYPLSRLEEAFRFMQSGAHSGKIVLVPHDEDNVMVSSLSLFLYLSM